MKLPNLYFKNISLLLLSQTCYSKFQSETFHVIKFRRNSIWLVIVVSRIKYKSWFDFFSFLFQVLLYYISNFLPNLSRPLSASPEIQKHAYALYTIKIQIFLLEWSTSWRNIEAKWILWRGVKSDSEEQSVNTCTNE